MKTIKESAEVGVIVARFQVPELHEEHLSLIQKVVNTHPRVLVILGLAADACKCTHNNPLDYPTRKAMIEKTFPNVEVLYIKDVGNNEVWSKDLDKIISSQIGPEQKVILYGGRDSFIPHYRGRYTTEELMPTKFISGKEIRKNVGIKSKGTKEFREGVIWAVENQWPNALPTVDVAIIDRNKNKLLVCRKPNQKLIRFVGGFANPNSVCYEDDALREVEEETHLIVANIQYICSRKINDWRFVGEKNKIKTVLFTADYIDGNPAADDDIAEVEWFAFETLNEEMFVIEHRELFNVLKEKVIDKVLNRNKVEYYPLTVAVALVKGNRVYVSQRIGTKNFDKKWQFAGGKLEKNELPFDGGAREVKEETGLDIDPARLRLIGEVTEDVTTDKCYMYVVPLADFETPKKMEELTSDWLLLPFDEVEKMDVMPGIKKVIETLKKIYGTRTIQS